MRILIISLLIACGTSAPHAEHAEPITPSPAVAQPTCDEEVAALDARLATLPDGVRLLAPAGMNAPAGHGAPIRSVNTEVALMADGTLVADGGLIEASGLQAALTYQAEQWALVHPGGEPYTAEFVAWVDESLKVEDVTRALSSDHTWRLIVTGSPRSAHSCPDSLGSACAAMESDEPASRAMSIAEALETNIVRCAPMTRFFNAFVNVDGQDKTRFYRAQVPSALSECDCDLDMEAFTFLSLAMLGGPGPAVYSIEAPSADHPAQTIGEYVRAHARPQ